MTVVVVIIALSAGSLCGSWMTFHGLRLAVERGYVGVRRDGLCWTEKAMSKVRGEVA